MKRHFSILLHLLLLLALSACGSTTGPTATKPSRLPDQNEVIALLVKLVDEEKR